MNPTLTHHGSRITDHASLVARGITRSFGEQRALDGVDLTIRAGEIHGLLGENGAGKTTLMNVLAGVVLPDAGTVTVAGQPLRLGSPSDSAAIGIGMVHQHFSLVPALTVAENLSLAAGSGPAVFRRSAGLAAPALAVAGRLGWRFDPDTPVWQLPIGHQQRLEILKTLQRDARWLLFDEPTAVLSPPEVEELFGVLGRLRSEGRSVVFISHKLAEVQRLCDRVTVLRHGRRVGELPRGATTEELARLMVGPGDGGDEDPTLCRENAQGAKARKASGENAKTRKIENAKGEEQGPGLPAAALQSARPLPSRISRFRSLRAFAAKEKAPDGAPVVESPALAVRDLRVRGRGGDAVRGQSFEVRRGEIFGIAGVDGNGQAELAEAVMGLRPAVGGRVLLGGASEDDPSRSKSRSRSRSRSVPRPGYIPQDRRQEGLVLPMSVRENLALEMHAAPEFRWGPALRLSRLWAAAVEMARRFDVRVRDERQPAWTLSGGNQQKIVVARALSGDRSLLVAVNPTRGLDIGATEYVHAQLRAARDAGVGVLLISTELDEVLALSDRIGILYAGQFQGIVPPTEPRERIGQMMGGAAVQE
jgi:simple sugar transport system ATP-binding protein